MTVWTRAPEVEQIAKKVIPNCHKHLVGAGIVYLWRAVHQTTKGKAVWAKTRLISGLNAYLCATEEPGDGEEAEPFFVIEFAYDVWVVLDTAQRLALVDHELCHCLVDEDGVLSTAPHDLEEFVGIVERHGMWRAEVQALVNAGNQGQLNLLDDAPV
jgi:hypothetical protein